jgi:hypothetical protein
VNDMDPDAYERELLDMGADPEDANAAAQELRRRQQMQAEEAAVVEDFWAALGIFDKGDVTF